MCGTNFNSSVHTKFRTNEINILSIQYCLVEAKIQDYFPDRIIFRFRKCSTNKLLTMLSETVLYSMSEFVGASKKVVKEKLSIVFL